MSRRRRPYDCEKCGACCHNVDENRARGLENYIEVKPTDEILQRPSLARRLVVLDDEGIPHMRLTHDRCAALEGTIGRKVTCGIYEVRPTPCRRLEAGSEPCMRYRAERGIVD